MTFCQGEGRGFESRRPLQLSDPLQRSLTGVLSLGCPWLVHDPSGGEITEHDARHNAGVFVLAFEDGTFDQVLSGPYPGSCPGTYTVTGNRVTMVASSDSTEWDCGRDTLGVELVDAEFQVTDDGLLLTDFTLSDTPDVT